VTENAHHATLICVHSRSSGADQPRSCPGHQDVTKMMGNIILVNSGFYMRENLSENYLQFWHAP